MPVCVRLTIPVHFHLVQVAVFPLLFRATQFPRPVFIGFQLVFGGFPASC